MNYTNATYVVKTHTFHAVMRREEVFIYDQMNGRKDSISTAGYGSLCMYLLVVCACVCVCVCVFSLCFCWYVPRFPHESVKQICRSTREQIHIWCKRQRLISHIWR